MPTAHGCTVQCHAWLCLAVAQKVTTVQQAAGSSTLASLMGSSAADDPKISFYPHLQPTSTYFEVYRARKSRVTHHSAALSTHHPPPSRPATPGLAQPPHHPQAWPAAHRDVVAAPRGLLQDMVSQYGSMALVHPAHSKHPVVLQGARAAAGGAGGREQEQGRG